MTDHDYQPCSHECNGCPTCDPGLRLTNYNRASSDWPCANFTEPATCLTAGVTDTGRCDWCRTQLPEPTTRLSVRINEDCANYVYSQMDKGETTTEIVRQALALHKFVTDGGRLLTAEAVAAIDSLTGDCFVTRQSVVRCADWVGLSFDNGTPFTEGACCLPCRVRSLVATNST